MENYKLRLNVDKTLEFFDESPGSSSGHATALVSVMGEDLGASLLQQYLKERYSLKMSVLMKGDLPVTPTLGKKKGHRLDRWLIEDKPKGGKRRLYQVEIKNWSAHAIGGEKLNRCATLKTLKQYRLFRWQIHWDEKRNRFKNEAVEKVLEKMKVPDDIKQLLSDMGLDTDVSRVEITPVVCFWEAMHPEGKKIPMFECDISESHGKRFKRVIVFSMSNYLRTLKTNTVELHMPSTIHRLGWLRQLLK